MISSQRDEFQSRTSSLLPEDMHVYWAWLNEPQRAAHGLSKVLSGDEKERAARFVRACDRRRFVVARATLRFILARYLECRPTEIVFSYERHGKPRLDRSRHGLDLEFSLAHSDDLVVVALSRGHCIGVDVERLRQVPDLPSLARTALSPHEQARLFALPQAQQLASFFTCWTRKEAYLKGRGDGLLMPLDAFDVSLVPGEPPALIASRSHPEDVCQWSIRDFTPVGGYVGTVAVEGPQPLLLVKQWSQWKPA